MNLTLLFFIAGSIILIGFLGNIIYEKIKIPDILVLIGIGILLGPVFKLVDHQYLTEFAKYFGTFALIVILFEGGMDIKIRMLLKELGNATLLVAISFISTTVSITAFLLYARSWELMPGLLMATVLSCTSAAIILPVLSKMSLKDASKTVLYIESAMSDVLAVVLAISLIEFVKLENIGIERPFHAIASSFSIAIVAGTVFGVFWYKALTLMANRKYSYMVTLGTMLIVVATVDFLGGSGPIAVLIFGIILGNCGDIPHLQTSTQCILIDETIKFFHGEVTFFIRTFFFVYIGMLITAEVLSQRNLVVSFSLLAIIVIMRYLSVEFMIRRTGRDKEEKAVLFYMLPRGLATAVLASFPVSAGIDGSEGFVVYAVSAIILTNIVMTIGVFHLERKQTSYAEKNAVSKTVS